MSHTPPAGRKPVSEINVVPYIDVMLVLLVVFMVTAPMLVQGVKVELPEASAEPIPVDKEEDLIILSIAADGQLYLNVGGDPKQSRPLEKITEQLAVLVKGKPDSTILIEGDERIPYGAVVKVMVALQQAGITNVGLVTDAAGQES